MNDMTFNEVSYRTSHRLRRSLTCEPKAAIRSPMQENAALRQGIRAFIKITDGGTDLHLARILVQRLKIPYELHKRLESVEHRPRLSAGVQLDKTSSNQIPQSAPRCRILIWSRHDFDQGFFKTRLLNFQIGLKTEGYEDIAGFQHATSSRAVHPTTSSPRMITIGRGIPHCLQRFRTKLKLIEAMG